MDHFLKYFEDKRFVRWVLQPDEALDHYWNYYLEKHPSERKEIELARLLISQLRSKEMSGSGTQSVELFSGIIEELEKSEKKQRFRRVFTSVMKYAAVAFLFFALGMVYYMIRESGPMDLLPEQLAFSHDDPRSQLILGDGENVAIEEKESSVEYRSDGKIVINQRDTVESEHDAMRQGLNQLIVPYGKNSSIQLPDGSRAWLNAGSRLVYPSFFEGKRREVFLIGEGYFEVAPDEEMPFVVQTSELDIEVLGTKFNVSAYPSENMVETVLVEGKVKLKRKGFQLIREDLILKPSQLAVFERTSAEMKVRNVDVLDYVAWPQGFLNFESVDLNRIVKKLERYYNIRIMLDDPMLGVRSISGKLRLKEEKEKVLAVLANTASARFVKLNETTYVIK